VVKKTKTISSLFLFKKASELSEMSTKKQTPNFMYPKKVVKITILLRVECMRNNLILL
jgi:hypothetical protein